MDRWMREGGKKRSEVSLWLSQIRNTARSKEDRDTHTDGSQGRGRGTKRKQQQQQEGKLDFFGASKLSDSQRKVIKWTENWLTVAVSESRWQVLGKDRRCMPLVFLLLPLP